MQLKSISAGPYAASRSGVVTGRLLVEFVLAGLVLAGVFWKDVFGRKEDKPTPHANTAQGPAPEEASAQEPVSWEYKVHWTTDLETLSTDVNRFGKQGWEMCASTFRIPKRGEERFEYGLVFKRRSAPVKQDSSGSSLVGVWQLTKSDRDREAIKELTLECTDVKTVRITFDDGEMHVLHGTYWRDGEDLLITYSLAKHNESIQGKIRKLTATTLVLEDHEGKLEEYVRK